MGGVLGGCFGSCAATCGCQVLGCCVKSFKDSRVPYLLITFLSVLTAGLLRYYGAPVLTYVEYVSVICPDFDKCVGIGAVYRITFSLCVFYLGLAVATQVRSCYKWGVDTGYWLFKILALLGLLVIAFLLPNQVFDGFRYFSQTVAGIFLVLQIILLIDFAYSWNDSWTREDKDWKIGIIAVSVTGYLSCLVAAIVLFVHFTTEPGADCSMERGFIVTTIVLTLIFTLISVSETCEHGALLPSTVCTSYCYWLLYSALADDPSTCNPLRGDDSPARVIGGFVLAAFSVAYAGFSVSNNTEALSLQSVNQSAFLEDQAPGDGSFDQYRRNSDSDKANDSDETTFEEVCAADAEARVTARGNQASKFHLVMAASACYACMLLTDWGGSLDGQSGPGLHTVWIKIASQWLTILLYTWSLVAPLLLPDRVFYEESYSSSAHQR